ncbi:hypothetical protein PInf_025595 [Phytophthora infestans]|nr:hypothetical protein PInf_025595 [Phytophthora infestans]
MPSFTIATENPISQIWKELTKKGWKYRTSRGLSNDGRYVPPGGSLSGTEGVDYFLGSDSLMRYCRKKGGFAFKIEPPAASEAPRPTPAASEATSPTPAAPEVTPPAAVVPETTSSTPIKSVESSPTRVALAAAAKPTPRKPRRAAKATSQADDQVQQAAVPPTRAEAKRKASGPNTKPKRRRSKAARDLELPVTEAPIGAVNAGRRGVTLDDFDGDGFLAALRRDRLFEVGGEDDFNVGDGDWLLSIDSDAEGDEESILQDENDAVDDNDFGSADDAESGDDAGVESEEVPVEFDLTAEDLDRLQEDEWDVYMEAESGRVQHDASPLYDGPSGPTRAALAFHDIARYLHFNDNNLQSDSNDRAFKIRPVIQALQKTDIDSALRSHSTREWLDIYCGKADAKEDSVDQRAVGKNLAKVLEGQPAGRLVCTDNFYTSIPLSHKLLSMGHCRVDTIHKARKG